MEVGVCVGRCWVSVGRSDEDGVCVLAAAIVEVSLAICPLVRGKSRALFEECGEGEEVCDVERRRLFAGVAVETGEDEGLAG